MNTFLSREEVLKMGFKSVGDNVLIGKTAIFYHPECVEIGNHVRIDDYCIISGKVKLGSYIHIAHFCGLYGGSTGITLMDFTGISSKSSLYAETNDYSGEAMTNPMVHLNYTKTISAPICLEKHAIVGTGCTVMSGVTIGEGAAVGAMSLVLKSVAPWTINVGIPCKAIKSRSRKLLECEKLFLDNQ